MWTRVIVFYILTFVFTIILGGTQEAAGLSAETIILPQWAPGLAGAPDAPDLSQRRAPYHVL